MRFNISFNNYDPYYVGECSDQTDGVSIRRIDRKIRFDWRTLRFRWARKFIVTYIGTDLGHMWVWEE